MLWKCSICNQIRSAEDVIVANRNIDKEGYIPNDLMAFCTDNVRCYAHYKMFNKWDEEQKKIEDDKFTRFEIIDI